MYVGTEVHFNVKCDEMAHWPNSDDVHVHHVVCYTMQELFPFFLNFQSENYILQLKTDLCSLMQCTDLKTFLLLPLFCLFLECFI